MKVLMLHNKYKIQGGEDISTNEELMLLKANGIEVDIFYVHNASIKEQNRIKIGFNSLWSKFYYKEVYNLIRANGYDVVHVQNFYPLLSPSILYAAKKAKAKVVVSIRNYRLVCPNALMYVNGENCSDCLGKKVPINAVAKKCYRKSLTASSAIVSMLSVHNLLKTWETKVDGFICISKYVKSQLTLGGFDQSKLHVKYNFVSSQISPKFEQGEYYIYVGRLSEEKGIEMLLDAFDKSDRKLKIIGTGPLESLVLNFSGKNKNIVFLGSCNLNDTYNQLSNAKALIFPSKWNEPFGRTIIEAFAHGTPVIGSIKGAGTELIKDGFNGFLFDPIKTSNLVEVIKKFEKFESATSLRQNAYSSYEEHFTSQNNFTQLIRIYKNL